MTENPNPESDTVAPRQLLLVTGLAGAGKSTTLDVLEDLGWETIDNFPVRMLKRLVSMPDETRGPLAIGFDSRTRGFVPADIIGLVKELSQQPGIALTFLFLDCAGGELERRFNETRRRHPMADGRPVMEGIAAERELLEPLRRWAEVMIDTTAMTSNDLQGRIRELFGPTSGTSPMTLTLSSFGFARGMPPLADLVFDMRFLDNPHWVPGLREQTGQDAAVGDHIRRDPAFADAFARIRDLLLMLLPRYAAQGKPYVHVAFGCTGGRHRSVFTAEQMAESLRAAGFSPTVRHRNLGSRAADAIEGDRR
ncbi:RNase adaptor protein RapZ [Porphyrobacter sp. HT-58-2]|uniref:RNase adapter RapZ n=1 Tax=Porphyrobacter sp. HT-58-2 TaxID=2023229 RepID=UPI000CDBE46C|nr:RNase adapter RapZ [Porphyrobacter sp. HT-58-2]AUX69339.1 RNase adaptor protein RapZ [Porphyrobacter sp. HT-58-2]